MIEFKVTAGERALGTVWFGRNFSGQLGDGTTADRSTPMQVPGLTNIIRIAAGYGHSLALGADGVVWVGAVTTMDSPSRSIAP
jgi:alpha-tubulin suppressor-like RCC1 family protein